MVDSLLKPAVLKLVVLGSGLDGCLLYRCTIPLNALAKRFGVEWQTFLFLPQMVGYNQFEIICSALSNFDLVIVQRNYVLDYVQTVRRACTFLGIPMVFETDDDYLSIIRSNPAYYSLADQGLFTKYMTFIQQGRGEEAAKMIPELEHSRLQGLENYKKILSLADWVTCSTEELARSIRVYNKNVIVFENNIERVWPWRDDRFENDFYVMDKEGKAKLEAVHRLGIYSIPNYQRLEVGGGMNSVKRLTRFGYTCTASHFGEDMGTIMDGLNKVLDKFQDECWMIWLGDSDRRFFNQQKARIRSACIPTQAYDAYIQNIRNIDVGLCPLYPTEFNMSKSDIKVVEYASWGIPAIIPHYITYTRNWSSEINCLSYRNQEEFVKQCTRLHTDKKLRAKLGEAAFDYVSKNRIAENSPDNKRRYDFYRNLVLETPRAVSLKPNKEVA